MTRAAVFLLSLLGRFSPVRRPLPRPPVRCRRRPRRPRPPRVRITPPALASERARRLDELYSRLREADNPRQARVLEAQIGMLMSVSGSDTAIS